MIVNESSCVVEEYKACARFPEHPNLVDLGQLTIYAAMFAMNREFSEFSLSLIYVDAETFEEHAFSYNYSLQTLSLLLAIILLCYELRHKKHQHRTIGRADWARFKEFPYPDFRFGQRALAGRVYRAAVAGEQLLVEAPTGSGKTLGTVYPLFKALEYDQKLFYLTSRSSGSIAALDAVKMIDPSNEHVVLVEIIAKEKICPVEGMPCDAELCPYAKGYFDRAGEAVLTLLDQKFIDRSALEDVAEKYTVCPFEISLDAALWADLVVCDYNYIFDPFVRLQRFQPPTGIHLLIDEAHQLFPRVNSMYSVELSFIDLVEATADAPSLLLRHLDLVRKQLAAVFDANEIVIEPPVQLNEAIARLLAALSESEIELSEEDQSLSLFVFSCYRWSAAQDWQNDGSFSYIVERDVADQKLNFSCIDSSGLIKEALSNYESSVCFSGTLSPLELYRDLHGGEPNLIERSPNPFESNQLGILLIKDISTYYKDRPRSIQSLVELVRSVLRVKRGRYLIAFPSFEYLELFFEAFTSATEMDCVQLKQESGMQARRTRELLDEFKESTFAMLGVVLGGVLGESIDFLESAIDGIFVVSVGLPPPSIERDLLAKRFKESRDDEWGQTVAYRQPAMNKVLQVCGRLIRSPSHRGMLYLIDPRYQLDRIRLFFPSHWHSVTTKASDVEKLTQEFWSDGEENTQAN